MQKKILIIKLGYSETLDPEIGILPSLGDVLRTTPMLSAIREKYPDSLVTWLVAREAEPLLRGNHLIDRILVWDSFVPFQLMKEKFDILVNLEKIAGVCALADMIDAWVKYGFRFESVGGVYSAYEQGLDFISYIEHKKYGETQGYWQQLLIEMLGVKWQGQEYLLGYKPRTKACFDIGFNHQVGSKWPNKAMPQEAWEELERRLLSNGFKVSWQEGHNDLFEYMDWINKCNLLISNDSLGLHLAMALGKRVVGLFGPTDPKEVFLYNDSRVLCSRSDCLRMPCYAAKCKNGLECMQSIDIDELEEVVNDMVDPLEPGQRPQPSQPPRQPYPQLSPKLPGKRT